MFGFMFTTEPSEISWYIVSSLPPVVMKHGMEVVEYGINVLCYSSAKVPDCDCPAASVGMAYGEGSLGEDLYCLTLQVQNSLAVSKVCLHVPPGVQS